MQTGILINHPINDIQWLRHESLEANNYNPNRVMRPEMTLLKTSLMRTGWVMPILVNRHMIERMSGKEHVVHTIIDGYHRVTLVKTDKEVAALSDGHLPCCVFDLSEPERKLMTVRINRAKGTHVAVHMSDLVKSLINEDGLTVEEICAGIGATRHEVEVLLMKDVFEKLGTAEHQYSKAWVPK